MKKRLVLKKMVIARLNEKEKAKVLGGDNLTHHCTAKCPTKGVTVCGGTCGAHIC